jgi:hypothetical protein
MSEITLNSEPQYAFCILGRLYPHFEQWKQLTAFSTATASAIVTIVDNLQEAKI